MNRYLYDCDVLIYENTVLKSVSMEVNCDLPWEKVR